MPLGLTHTKKLFQNRDATQFSQACVLISLLGRRDKNHPSVVKVKETFKNAGNFELPKASRKGINKIIKSLNSKKATGPDKIPPKLIKLAANIIACHICIRVFHLQRFLKKSKLLMLDRYIKKAKGKKLKTIDPAQYHLS